MAFSLYEKNGLSWTASDVLGGRHMFTRRLGEMGEFPYSAVPDPVWGSDEVQTRVRQLWLRLRDAGGFPPEGFCFTRQIHGTVIRTGNDNFLAMMQNDYANTFTDALKTANDTVEEKLDGSVLPAIRQACIACGLETDFAPLAPSALPLLVRDKKADGKGLELVLLEKLGKPVRLKLSAEDVFSHMRSLISTE